MARTRSQSNTEAPLSSSASTSSDASQAGPHASTVNPPDTSNKPVALSSTNTGLELYLPRGHTRVSRLAATLALEQLRTRLDVIDEHSRDLRNARRILVKREEASSDFSTQRCRGAEKRDKPMSDMDVDMTYEDELMELEPPSKRRTIDSPVITRPGLRPLVASPTLLEYCPPEFQQPSTSLPRPLEESAAPKTPQSSPKSKCSVRNGIRFPPGSAPRPSAPRSRSSSPALTQMLPPPVPSSLTSSPVTPKPTKLYEPLVGKLNAPLFPAAPESRAHTPTSRRDFVEIPASALTSNPFVSWQVTYLGPERTPSPPIGENKITWAPKVQPDERRRFVEPKLSVPESKVEAQEQEFGPASRTRAKANNAAKGRV